MQAIGSLSASITILRTLRDGPNPEYFSKRKQKLLNLLTSLELQMKEIRVKEGSQTFSFFDLCNKQFLNGNPSSYAVTDSSQDAVNNFHKVIQAYYELVDISTNSALKGKRKQLENFLYNDTLGTIDEMRV